MLEKSHGATNNQSWGLNHGPTKANFNHLLFRLKISYSVNEASVELLWLLSCTSRLRSLLNKSCDDEELDKIKIKVTSSLVGTNFKSSSACSPGRVTKSQQLIASWIPFAGWPILLFVITEIEWYTYIYYICNYRKIQLFRPPFTVAANMIRSS